MKSGKWKVKRGPWSTWIVLYPDHLAAKYRFGFRYFDTWGEAVAFIDLQCHLHTVVLPRPKAVHIIPPARDALDQVREALIKIDQERERARARINDAPTHYAWGQEVGREQAYQHAHTIITRALGDTP